MPLIRLSTFVVSTLLMTVIKRRYGQMMDDFRAECPYCQGRLFLKKS
ncbi:MAG TPA: hypothetical protein VJ936_06985 [Desulfobacteraceae bacterium]|nr:hypothetical protein [Desulfobacteraceae bacterium]